MINIRSRNQNRPFTTIVNLEKEAQTKFEGRLKKLEEEQQAILQEKTKLESTGEGNNQFTLRIDPEALKAIQAKELEKRKQIREIRKQLRAEIDLIQLKIKLSQYWADALVRNHIWHRLFYPQKQENRSSLTPMKGKQLLIAVLALGILGGIAYFTLTPNQGSPAKTGVGKIVVTDLDPAKIATIAITDNDASLTLAQQDEQWIITERDGFAAKFDDIQKLVT